MTADKPIGTPTTPAIMAQRRLGARQVRLSHSYQIAMSAGITAEEATDPSRVQRAALKGITDARGPDGLRVADALAAALISRALNLEGRDGVAAIKELADRTEGPVVQRTLDASVRYVVSISPTSGHLGTTPETPLTLDHWQDSALSEWEEAQRLALAAGGEPMAQVGDSRIAQGKRGS